MRSFRIPTRGRTERCGSAGRAAAIVALACVSLACVSLAAPSHAQSAADARSGVTFDRPAFSEVLEDAPVIDDAGTGLWPTAAEWRLYAVMPFLGAAGAQIVGSPEKWDRTWEGYAYRLGDQAGFLVVEESVRRGLRAAIGAPAPSRSCWQDERAFAAALVEGAGCAIARTFVEQAPDGSSRLNAPTIVSVLAATGASLAWRPERADAAKARSFLLVRTGIVFGGLASSRLFDDWRAAR